LDVPYPSEADRTDCDKFNVSYTFSEIMNSGKRYRFALIVPDEDFSLTKPTFINFIKNIT